MILYPGLPEDSRRIAFSYLLI